MTQIQPYKQKIKNVQALLEAGKKQLEMALPRHLTADRMARIVLTEVQKTPKLLDCTQESLLGAVVQAAQLGLEPGLAGMAYLVPFKGKVQLIPGYRGLMTLAQRSGNVSTIFAEVVCEPDSFKYELGLELVLRHIPDPSRDPNNQKTIEYAYAVAQLKDGGKQFVVMSKAEVDAIRARSRASGNGPWVTDYAAMAKKTVIRQLCKYLPMSVELQTAVTLDEYDERGITQDLDSVLPVDMEIPAQEAEPDDAALVEETEGEKEPQA